MTLSTGLDIARSSLSVNADRASTVARNIASAGDPNATRKNVNLVTADSGGVRVGSISRDFDEGLFKLVQASRSEMARHAAVAGGLDAIYKVIGSPDQQTSPAAIIGKLRDDLTLFANTPHESASAARSLASARDVVQVLHVGTDTVQGVRAQADEDIRNGVERLNTLLNEFDDVNSQIIAGARASRDVTDDEDARTNILAQISELINVKAIPRSDNDMVVVTGGGLVLYEEIPRTVVFRPTTAFDAGTQGSPIYVDGMAITGATSIHAAHSGNLVGLAVVRDDLAVTAQAQLDELAAGLVALFSEADQVGGSAVTQPGLFTYGGAPAMPVAGTVMPGLARNISINASVDPAQGGDISRLRDGGISDPGNPTYLYNAEGGAGFNDRLLQLVDGFGLARPFDGAMTKLSSSTDLLSFSVESTSWVQEQRRVAADQETRSAAVFDRASFTLSKATGVNLDEEMTLMLDIERSYQASARLIASIDSMFDALFVATG